MTNRTPGTPHRDLACVRNRSWKEFSELVRELEQNFPSDKIHEALKRMVDRRSVVPTPRSSVGAAAAYWASLGLLPETPGFLAHLLETGLLPIVQQVIEIR